MKPLMVLLGAYILAYFIAKLAPGSWTVDFAGCIALSAMLLFSAMRHFRYPDGMAMMMPAWVPLRKLIVWLSGVFEGFAGLGMLFWSAHQEVAVILLLFFASALPVNIYASFRHINYKTAASNGRGPRALWFRIPLHLLYIGWTWYFGLPHK